MRLDLAVTYVDHGDLIHVDAPLPVLGIHPEHESTVLAHPEIVFRQFPGHARSSLQRGTELLDPATGLLERRIGGSVADPEVRRKTEGRTEHHGHARLLQKCGRESLVAVDDAPRRRAPSDQTGD